MPKKKADLDKLIKKYQPVMKKTGAQLAKAVKSAEEDIAKMYRIAQAHMEIQVTNLQKERVYHDIGREIASKIMKEEVDIPSLEKYKKKLSKLDLETAKKKKAISKLSKARKKKK